MIRAEIRGARVAEACGVTVNANAPMLALCRKLLAMAFDPKTPLEAWRDDTMCLRVRSLAEGAKLTVDEAGPRFSKHREWPEGSLNTGSDDREVA